MINRRASLFFVLLLSMSLSSLVKADDQSTNKQVAQDLVNKAIDFYKSNGKDKAFSEISTPNGKFSAQNGEIYVFVYDTKGTVMAHGQNPQEIGLNKLGAKDPNGVFYVRERIEMTKNKPDGWQDYLFKEPKTGKSIAKTSYVKRVDNYIFGCGIYK